ncbi:MAG: YqgE/AlgH family protein [Pseudomonadota bacterium]
MADLSSDIQDSETLTGRLIVAMPHVQDSRFERSVIFLFAHQADGAMGLIINRPTEEISFADLLSQLDLEFEEDNDGMVVRVGGPVETDRGFVLHSTDYHREEATIRVNDGTSVTATIDVLKAMASGDGPDNALFALGYSGWGPGQLEREIRDNTWLHCEADSELLFNADDDDKWELALAKIGIDPSLLSTTAGTA